MPGSRVNRCRPYRGKNTRVHADRDDDRGQHDPDPSRDRDTLRITNRFFALANRFFGRILFTLRSVISQFTLDKQRAPQSLDDIVQAGYIKQVPNDPFTNRNDTWQLEQEDVLLAVDQQQPGITDVHSGANLTASDGTSYSSW